MTSNDVWTVQRVLEWTVPHLKKHNSETPRLDAEILLAHARNCQRIELYTQYADPLTNQQRDLMRALVQRRANAEPVAYLVGHREFFGLDFQVTPDVLIPRPDTETLVIELLEVAKDYPSLRLLDIGTGSGCIAISAAVNVPRSQITAVDLHKSALEVARVNAAKHDMTDRIRFLQGDLFESLTKNEQFDVIVSNPPYIAENELESLQADVRLHEPGTALNGGPDGLDIIRPLIENSPNYLAPGGSLLIEIASEQANDVRDLLQNQSYFCDINIVKDLSGKPRVVRAKKQH